MYLRISSLFLLGITGGIFISGNCFNCEVFVMSASEIVCQLLPEGILKDI